MTKNKLNKDIKTINFYKELLAYFPLETLEKIKSIIELIIEEIKVANDKYLYIEQDEFFSRGILLAKTKKILQLLSGKQFQVIPPLLKVNNKKPNYFIMSPPYCVFNKTGQESKPNHPYKENFKNLRMALNELIKLKRQGKEFYGTQNGKLKFIKEKALIKLGNLECQIPICTKQSSFCEEIFKQPIGILVSWDIIYEKMAGSEPDNLRKNWRMVYDASKKVEEKLKKTLGIKNVFIWRNRTITRIR